MVTHAKFWRWLVTLLAGIMVTQVVVTSMTSAQIAGADGGRDLGTLIADHTILDSVNVSFKDANGNEIDSQHVTADTTMNIKFSWSLPDNVVSGGDFFTFKLPDQYKIKDEINQPLSNPAGVHLADLKISTAGIVTITFTDNARRSDMKGSFGINTGVFDFDNLGNQNLLIPLNREETTSVPIHVIPNQRVDIAKASGKQVGDSDEVDWQLGINNESLQMTNAVIHETMDPRFRLAGVEIETATANPTADSKTVTGWTGTGVQLVEGKDFEIRSNDIHLIGDYAKTNSPLLVTVKTKLVDPDQAVNWETISNKVSLEWQGQDMPPSPPTADNQITLHYVPKKWLEKYSQEKPDDNGNFRWTVEYNQQGLTIPANTQLTDTLDDNQSFVQEGAGNFSLSTGSFSGGDHMDQGNPLVVDKDYTVDYSGNTMTITLLRPMTVPLLLKYNVHVAEPKNKLDLTNTVADNHEHQVTATKTLHYTPDLKKQLVDVDEANHQMNYSVDVNATNQPMTDLTLVDIMSRGDGVVAQAGLTHNSLKLVDETTKATLNVGADYSVEVKDNQFTVKLLGKYAQTSDHFTMTYSITYEPVANRQFTWKNTIDYPDITSATTEWPPAGSDNLKPEKEVHYDAQTGELNWTILVNQGHAVLHDATVRDPIESIQRFKSVELYTADANGKPDQLIKDFKVDLPTDQNNQTVKVYLPEDTNEAYVVLVKTKPADPTKYPDLGYADTGYYFDGNAEVPTDPKKVWPTNQGNILDKSGSQVENSDQVNWNVRINMALARLTNAVITDIASPNQIVDEDSFEIYPVDLTQPWGDEIVPVVNTDAPLKQNVDYEIEKTILDETGQTQTTIRFLHQIDQAYEIQYHSNIYGGAGKVTNGVKIRADQVTQDKTDFPVEVTVKGITWEIDGKLGTYHVLKTGPSGEKLAGAKFVLTPVSGGNARSATSDANGIATWKELYTGSYYLKEVEAPAGYQISPEYQGQGKQVDIVFTTDNLEQTITVVNEKAILPHTGGWQRAIALLIGTMLLALAGWLIVARMKKAGEVR